MDAKEFVTMVDETVPVDHRQYPTIDDYTVALAIIHQELAEEQPASDVISVAPVPTASIQRATVTYWSS